MFWLQFLLALVLFILDRVTKFWALSYLASPMSVFSFFNFKLNFDLAFNHGVSWGLFSSNSLISKISLITVILVILSYLVFHTVQKLRAGRTILGESLIIAGALSNLCDRLIYGAVIDFIHVSFEFNNLSWNFPIFNLADMGIFIGVCMMLFREYYPEKL